MNVKGRYEFISSMVFGGFCAQSKCRAPGIMNCGVLIINKPFKVSPLLAGFPITPTHYNTVCRVVEKPATRGLVS